MIDSLIRRFVDRYLGLLFDVDPENVYFSPSAGGELRGEQQEGEVLTTLGLLKIERALLKSEALAELHFPVCLKAGFVRKLQVHLPPMGLALGLGGEATVEISDALFVFTPNYHDVDWKKHDKIQENKQKIVDFIVKFSEIFKKKAPHQELNASKKGSGASSDGFMASMKKKIIEDMKSRILGMLRVNISNFQIRFEDPQAPSPCLGAFQLSYLSILSQPSPKKLRCGGRWDPHLRHHQASYRVSLPLVGMETGLEDLHEHLRRRGKAEVPNLLSHDIQVKGVSVFWDLDVRKEKYFSALSKSALDLKMTSSQKFDILFVMFRKQVATEKFRLATCTLLQGLKNSVPDPLDSFLRRRGGKHLPSDEALRLGMRKSTPQSREGFDYHRYILFPCSLSVHFVLNKSDQQAGVGWAAGGEDPPQCGLEYPLRDLDVICDNLLVAIDARQMTSINQMQGELKKWSIKDLTFRTRPTGTIAELLASEHLDQGRLSMVSSPSPKGHKKVFLELKSSLGNSTEWLPTSGEGVGPVPTSPPKKGFMGMIRAAREKIGSLGTTNRRRGGGSQGATNGFHSTTKNNSADFKSMIFGRRVSEGKWEQEEAPKRRLVYSEKTELIRSWWRHAERSVRLHASIPSLFARRYEIRDLARLKNSYLDLLREKEEAHSEAHQKGGEKEALRNAKKKEAELQEKLKIIEVRIPLSDIFSFRAFIKAEFAAKNASLATKEEGGGPEGEEGGEEEEEKEKETDSEDDSNSDEEGSDSPHSPLSPLVLDKAEDEVEEEEDVKKLGETLAKKSEQFRVVFKSVKVFLLFEESLRQLKLQRKPLMRVDISVLSFCRIRRMKEGGELSGKALIPHEWVEVQLEDFDLLDCEAKKSSLRHIMSLKPYKVPLNCSSQPLASSGLVDRVKNAGEEAEGWLLNAKDWILGRVAAAVGRRPAVMTSKEREGSVLHFEAQQLVLAPSFLDSKGRLKEKGGEDVIDPRILKSLGTLHVWVGRVKCGHLRFFQPSLFFKKISDLTSAGKVTSFLPPGFRKPDPSRFVRPVPGMKAVNADSLGSSALMQARAQKAFQRLTGAKGHFSSFKLDLDGARWISSNPYNSSHNLISEMALASSMVTVERSGYPPSFRVAARQKSHHKAAERLTRKSVDLDGGALGGEEGPSLILGSFPWRISYYLEKTKKLKVGRLDEEMKRKLMTILGSFRSSVRDQIEGSDGESEDESFKSFESS